MGSVIFHLLLVVGVVAMVQPLPRVIEDAIMNAIPAMALVMLLLLPVLFNGLHVPRWEAQFCWRLTRASWCGRCCESYPLPNDQHPARVTYPVLPQLRCRRRACVYPSATARR